MHDYIYFDNASTTPVHPEVIEAMADCMKNDYGNPSSLHRLGIVAEKRLKNAREQVAELIKVNSADIIFTSGGTESNNLSIIGSALRNKRHGKHCITSSVEHPSVLNTFRYLEKQGFEVTYLPVNKEGLINLSDLENALSNETILVSIMHVNNEIGSMQPIQEIGSAIRSYSDKIVFHVDAIQSYGKVDIKAREWGIDIMSISGHKIHGPKGVGALYIRKGVTLQPLLWGGEQEKELRSGTENIPGIVGLGKACEMLKKMGVNRTDRLYRLKESFIKALKYRIPTVVVNGAQLYESAPHIISVSFAGIKGEVLLHSLEDKGIFVSTGSACSSRRKRISHVLQAINLEPSLADGTIRISLSVLNTQDEIQQAVDIICQSVEQLQFYKRR